MMSQDAIDYIVRFVFLKLVSLFVYSDLLFWRIGLAHFSTR